MDKVIEKIRPLFLEKGSAHGFDHALRVFNLGSYIAKKERADLEIVQLACLLHDIGRNKGKDGEDRHEEIGAEISREILKSLDFPEDKIKAVEYCVRVHRYSKGINPESVEAKIVQDADRLEEIGAIAIARGLVEDMKKGKPLHDPSVQPNSIYKSGGNKTSINFLKEKSLKLRPETFHTKTAQEMARGRYTFTEEFVSRVIEEWGFCSKE